VTHQGFSNRILVVNGVNQALSTPLFSSCCENGTSAGRPHDITFIINVNADASSFTTIYVNGTFN
jgi:hypothetical protein